MFTARKIVASLAVGLVASAIGITGAKAALAPQGGGIVTGEAEVASSAAGPVFSLPNVTLGESAAQTVLLSNPGEAAGRFRMSAATQGDRALAKRILVKVSAGSKGLYAGPLSGLRALELGELSAGGSLSLQVETSLPASGSQERDNALQGLSTSTTITWTTTQV